MTDEDKIEILEGLSRAGILHRVDLFRDEELGVLVREYRTTIRVKEGT